MVQTAFSRERMISTKAQYQEAKGRTLTLGLFLVALMAASFLLAAKPAHAIDFTGLYTVNSTADEADANVGNGGCATSGGACTLRAAIQEANATTTGDDIISFNIPSTDPNCNANTGVCTISPATLLPIIRQPVAINGYSQPGASKNTLAVGDNAQLRIRLNKPPDGAPSGLWLDTNDSVVRGLSITGFSSGTGIIVAGDNNTVEGNFIGTDPGGIQAGAGNYTGVNVQSDSSNNLVGGRLPGARNVISGNGRDGVRINTDPNEEGNRVQGNYIGTTKSGTGDLGNASAGVAANSFADSENLIGGTTRAAANTIAFNGVGVEVGDGFVPTGISILSNSIFSNDGLGIDLNGDGITPNDGPGDPDTGPNNLQNFPTITSARTGLRATTIQGALYGIPSSGIATGYIIQFFSSPKGTKDEGKKFIGERVVVDGNGDGIMPFTFKPSRKVRVGMFVTATATYDPTDDTSEFSAPKKVL